MVIIVELIGAKNHLLFHCNESLKIFSLNPPSHVARLDVYSEPRFGIAPMSYTKVGGQSRKTGIIPSEDTQRDSNNFENVNDFFEINGGGSAAANSRRTPTKPKLQDSRSKGDSDSETPDEDSAGVSSDVEIISPVASNLPSNPFNKRAEAVDKKPKQKTSPKNSRVTKNIALNKNKTKKNTAAAVVPARTPRIRHPPVEFWRNEKVLYKYDKNRVPSVVNVITKQKEQEPVKKVVSRKRKPAKSMAEKVEAALSRVDEPQEIDSENEDLIQKKQIPTKAPVKKPRAKKAVKKPSETKALSGHEKEKSWMKDGNITLLVFEGPHSNIQTERTVAWAADKEKTTTTVSTAQDQFLMAVLFNQEEEFAASGILRLPIGGVKSTKNSGESYFMFYVCSGELEVRIGDVPFVIDEGGSFEVPMGNFYGFINIGNTEAKLFFIQARYVQLANGPAYSDED